MMMAELFDLKDWQEDGSRHQYHRGNGCSGCAALRSLEVFRLIDDAVAACALRLLVRLQRSDLVN